MISPQSIFIKNNEDKLELKEELLDIIEKYENQRFFYFVVRQDLIKVLH